MATTVTIGEFSRLTYLSVKTLHHYHEVGLLEPASIDVGSGYRRYDLDQVGQAHLIRRLRDLNMPVAQVREVVSAPNQETSDAALKAHLTRMETELERTRDVVASLRLLLSPGPALAVDYRTVPDLPALAVSAIVSIDDIFEWSDETFGRLAMAAGRLGIEASGPAGATYAREFFEDDAGEVVAFLPVPAATGEPTGDAAVTRLELPGGRFAVTEHVGLFDDFDRTYGALGSHVARNDEGLPDPIRERYLVGSDETDHPSEHRTEICWPLRSA
ncbi:MULTISPECIES: MerR family transcriptional regulator [unclassified Nocardioides]|uniref:MerR family transcriptional regulator n=1 Tax=unclassified Nocardioides TaxID=2615069 RepID=UPI0006F47393|nr:MULTISPECIES: MerR family transcriptional regulator [unclassified Nocardioides]KQY54625.1 transcriptional regulator [Nocardioides sp. Root140]KQZ66499.1 transcriptional regulator [Nocardioides sp. Root151]KRF19723.1 transcriptional regulator [Nocardioides sp. Soil796]